MMVLPYMGAYLTIIASSDKQGRRQHRDAVSQVRGCVGSCKGPADIGSCISDVSTHTAAQEMFLVLSA